jgi:DNA topoisomerase IB
MQDRKKFERVLAFGRALPRLRDAVDRDLSLDGLQKARALACAVRLLDLGFFRVGGEEYAEEHETFGIATLRKSHVKLQDGHMVFDYPAKGSVRRVVSVADPQSSQFIKEQKARRSGGPNLLAYQSGGRWSHVKSDEVNAYIRAETGGEFSAKDFRTWAGTVLGAVELAQASAKLPKSKTARARTVSRAVKNVSEYLGNTPAVCRRSYVDPRVVDRFVGGETIAPALLALGPSPDIRDRSVREAVESAVVDLITEEAHAHPAAA